MDIISALNDKAFKSTEKRKEIITALRENVLTGDTLESLCNSLNEKQLTLVMEAVEEITREASGHIELNYLTLANRHISAKNNSLRREAARVIGNLAARFPDQMADIIPRLLENTKNSGTVIRWSGAYALAQIVSLPQYAVTPLYDTLTALYESEADNGVKKQYLVGLKKAKKIRNI